MHKFWIIGSPGAGKSYLSLKIFNKYNIDYYELDNIYWLKNWQRQDNDTFRKKVTDIMTNDSWIIDGYYEQVKDIIEEEKPFVVIVKKNILVLLFRVIIRSFKRIILKKKVCGENFENISFLFSKEGMIQYTIQQSHFFSNDVMINCENIFIIKNNKDIDKLFYFIDKNHKETNL